ncbi:hypothetical protein BCR32DRAFT_8940 [Anaeromyces robustus]|uniref:L domain-like protein n=1 Tax=Anaeromyces robustus TaxID=1754192 RepID=A0A1Y1X7E5_9FUNG|nr:hypothetical protein BCR32DRAFT_8940 [Anaeromyces robustus]|eukprot:ORX81689.1 hypothetical protein BCR32DRAFT_8940 [Anaeromyces robustus]
MENLETLDLSDNQFKGKIPIFLTNLKNLQKLDLGGNSFEGKIPYEFKELTKLNSFSLNGNEGLTGYIPYFPEIKECDYDKTNLCDLKYSNCKRTQYTYIDQHYCNDYDIKVTNSENGNPDPDYDPNKDVPFTKKIAALYNSYNPISFILLMGIIGFILYTLYYIICKCTNSLRNKIQQKIEKETTPLNNESNESVQNQNNQILKELNDLVLLSTLAYSINEQSEKNKNQENEKSNSMNNNHDDNDNDNNNNNNNNNDNNNNNNNNNNNHAEYNESNGKNNNENNIPTSSIPTLNVPPTSYAPGSYTYQPNTSNPNYVPGPYQPIPPSPNFVPGSYSPIPPSPIPGSQESMPLLQPQPPVPGSQDSMPLIQSPPPPGSFVYQMPSYPPPPPGYYPVLVPVPPTISVEDQSQPPNYSSVSASAPQINTDNKKVDNDKNEKK